jgi:ATP-dependent DNA helicase RecG
MPLILENAPNVTFSEVAGLFIASFQRPTALETPDTTQEIPDTTQKTTQDTTQDTTQETPETTPETPENTKKTPRKHQENTRKTPENTKKTPRKHQETVRKILLQRLRQQPESSVRALAETLGMSGASVRHHLRRLRAENKIRRVGPDKGGYWEVIGEP